ncbi:MAG TPA: hypothetical protein VF806_07485 [Anaerolineaceae bacterium]
MNEPTEISQASAPFHTALPILELLNPRKLTVWAVLSAVAGVAVARLTYELWATPLWISTLIVLLLLLPVGTFKWRDDRRRYGTIVMVISILLVAQGTHTIEHIVQWVEYHILFFTPRQSNGLLSPANSEWVHFTWNWIVLATVLWLVFVGKVRNFWMYVLLAVAMGHTAEHTYLFIRFIQVQRELGALALNNISAQGLPGFFGRDGWLARSPLTFGTFLRTLPGLTTAIRLDVHFWWNMIEITATLIAVHAYLHGLGRAPKAESAGGEDRPAPGTAALNTR